MTVSGRLADIRVRHAKDGSRLYAARISREPLLSAAVARVQQRLDDADRSDSPGN
jgi:hypothetical protein